MVDPYKKPDAELRTQESEPIYVGFWPRVGASIVDSILIILITLPLIWMVYGKDYWFGTEGSFIQGPLDVLISYVLPAVLSIVFWFYKSATPGKMVLNAKIVDANTGGPVPTGRLILRYIGYYLSILPIFLGFFWIAWDKRKQGFHDKIAKTVVVRR